MIIDFHTHVLAPEDQGQFTGAKFHTGVGAHRDRAVPNTVENVLEAAKIGGVDISVISNPLHNMRDMDREQQLAAIKRHNRFIAEQQEKYDFHLWLCRRSAVRRRPFPPRVRACR